MLQCKWRKVNYCEGYVSVLPIFQVSESLLTALKTHNQVLLHAPTGAGKSTALPLEILNSGLISGRIIMLEPRRIAARNVAYRLAEQLGEPIGKSVGYRMRAESRVSAETRLEVVTEGILTRMLQQDAMLEGVGLVILDEFHERSLQADLGLALLLDTQQGLRDDLKILIMSATLDNQRLSLLFPHAPVIVSQGRSFPVERQFYPLNPHKPFAGEVASAVWQLMQQDAGSLLLFLPGVGEIQRTLTELSAIVSEDILLCPLYGALSMKEQQEAISPAPAGRRKIVLATNIAETSLTIEGISLVVDSGLERVNQFNPRTGLTKLVKQRISQASMTQRAGRAGRLEPGICWHLFTKEQAERAPAHSEAEILHSDLAPLWLSVLQWGCHSVSQLQWLDCPPAPSIQSANTLLQKLGATNEQGQLSSQGLRMAETGSDPRCAAMLYFAAQTKDKQAIKLAALLTAILEEPPRKDHCDLAYWLDKPTDNWCRRATQLSGMTINASMSRELASSAWLSRLLVAGFPDRIAKNRDNQARFQLANGSGACMELHDKLASQSWLVVPSLWQSQQSADSRIGLAASLDITQLEAECPELFQQQASVEWDEKRGSLIASKRTQCGQLVVRSERLTNPSNKELKQALLHWVRTHGLEALTWSEAATQLHIRLQLAAQWFPEQALPSLDNEDLLLSLEVWLLPFLQGVTNLTHLKSIDLAQALLQRLDWQQKRWLEDMLPAYYVTPTEHKVDIIYSLEKPPLIAVRIQEMYGEIRNPQIANGAVTVTLSLLSPAMRPLQITQDLGAFWQGSYREIQKEMKGRYPKHLWPDSPENTRPTRKTKKAMEHSK